MNSIRAHSAPHRFAMLYPRLLSVSRSVMQGVWRTAPLCHAHAVASLVTEGSAVVTIGGAQYTKTPGSVMLYSPGMRYSGTNGGSSSVYRALIVQADFGSRRALPIMPPPFRCADAARILASIPALIDGERTDDLSVKTALLAFIRLFFPDAAVPDDTAARIHGAESYLRAHIGEPFSLEVLAADARMSASRLRHLYRERTGRSLRAFYLSEKIEAAKRMLLTGRPIADISDELGFASVHHFTAVFTKIAGAPPARFRRAAVSYKSAAAAGKDRGDIV